MYSQPSYQQQSEISYSVHGTQPKFEPISFLVSSSQEHTRPTVRTSAMTTEDERSITMNQYQTRGRPTQRTGAAYGDSKQIVSRDYETMETESNMQSTRFPYSTQQTSYETSRPTFTKVRSSNIIASSLSYSVRCRLWRRSMRSNIPPFKSPCISRPSVLNRLGLRYNGFITLNLLSQTMFIIVSSTSKTPRHWKSSV
jgi:hypothetical protein